MPLILITGLSAFLGFAAFGLVMLAAATLTGRHLHAAPQLR